MSEPKLDDLDRCEHGRKSIDNCFSCPGGWSTGNLFIANGQRIGTSLCGEPILAVTRRELRDGSPHPVEESNWVTHARRELALVGEEPNIIEWYVNVVKAYSAFGHSGGSMAATAGTLLRLLQFQNLTPLTDDPAEWFHHGEDTWGETGGIWQNIRNGEAFSHDGGKTYYLNSEGGRKKGPQHTSKKSGKNAS